MKLEPAARAAEHIRRGCIIASVALASGLGVVAPVWAPASLRRPADDPSLDSPSTHRIQGQSPTRLRTHLAETSRGARSPFPNDFTGNPLLPGHNQRSVAYLLSNGGYSAPLWIRRTGTLRVTWIAVGASTPITLATGQGRYRAPGEHQFRLRLTRDGRTALRRTTDVSFWVAASYARTARDPAWLCVYQVTVDSAHKLVFSNACGP